MCPPGETVGRVTELFYILEGYVLIDDIHIMPTEWIVIGESDKSAEHIKLIMDPLEEYFPGMVDSLEIKEVGDL
jgi:hypothetical protein